MNVYKTPAYRLRHFSVVKNSNLVSHLFGLVPPIGEIRKNAKQIISKKAKAVAFRLGSPTGGKGEIN